MVNIIFLINTNTSFIQKSKCVNNINRNIIWNIFDSKYEYDFFSLKYVTAIRNMNTICDEYSQGPKQKEEIVGWVGFLLCA